MNTLTAKRFLIVDDDPTGNYLSKLVIRKSLGEIEVKVFVAPEVALEYIASEFVIKPDEDRTVLLLDINMPTLTGWEFLDRFKTFAYLIQRQFNIYILSSSLAPADIHRAKQYPIVLGFLEKPLNKATITKMFA